MIPVLDRGHVRLVGASPDQVQLLSLPGLLSGQLDERVLKLCAILLEVKCPLFIRTQLTDLGFSTTTVRSSNEIEAWVPAPTDLKSKTIETDQELFESMKQTSEALLLNVKSYQMDGCDTNLAQVNVPVSVYTTILLDTNLHTMRTFFLKKGLNPITNLYRKAFLEALLIQWKDLRTILHLGVNKEL